MPALGEPVTKANKPFSFKYIFYRSVWILDPKSIPSSNRCQDFFWLLPIVTH